MKRLFTLLFVLSLCIMLAACQSLCSHEFESEITIAPGCESDGELTKTCAKCGYSETEPVSMTGHVFDSGTVTQEPVCGVKGVRTYRCTGCDATKTEDIPALVHNFDAGAVTREPSCAEQGEMTYTCTNCAETKQEPIDMVAHTFGESVVTKEATCKEEGEISTICDVCGYAEVVEQIAKTEDHIFEEVQVRAPTCIDKGEGNNVCTVCELTEVFEYEYVDHTYGTAVVLQYATCTESGQKQYTCIHCAYSYTESIGPNGHAYGSGVTVQQPSCAEYGTKQYTCSDCGYVYTETLAKTEHTWGSGTCGQPITCTTCGYTDYNGREHSYELAAEWSPGINTIGGKRYTCSVCGNSYSRYFGLSGSEYNTDTVRQSIIDYAKIKGFQIVYSSQPGTQYIEKHQYDYRIVDNSGGQSLLISWGTNFVEYLCAQLSEDSIDPANCKLLVTVDLSRSSSNDVFVIKLVAYSE